MRYSTLLSAIPHTLTGDGNTEISAIEYNSAKTRRGSLFVCLVGARSDGHRYARMAYDCGCRAFLAERELGLPADAAVAITQNTREALGAVSACFYGHPAEKLTLIGVTGTKGKTSTALLLSAILNGAGKPCAYIGSNGVTIGERHLETVNTTPESRDLHAYFSLMVEAGIQYAVLEVSSQALAHSRVRGLTFDTAIYTNLSPDHIGEGEHDDFADYMRAKARLFTEYGVRHVIYNADDPMWESVVGASGAPRVSYATDREADFFADTIAPYRDETTLGTSFACHTAGGITPVRLLSPGAFSVHNALAAMAAAAVYGVTPTKSAEALAHASVTGRFEIVRGLAGRVFVIDYAHNGLSLFHALSVLRTYQPKRLVCLFGSVGGRTQGRRAELGAIASTHADFAIVTSDNPDWEAPEAIIDEIVAHMDPAMPHVAIADREEAIRYAVRHSEEGDILLFAGKGHERYQLINGRKVPFSERRVIEEECALLAEKTE